MFTDNYLEITGEWEVRYEYKTIYGQRRLKWFVQRGWVITKTILA